MLVYDVSVQEFIFLNMIKSHLSASATGRIMSFFITLFEECHIKNSAVHNGHIYK